MPENRPKGATSADSARTTRELNSLPGFLNAIWREREEAVALCEKRNAQAAAKIVLEKEPVSEEAEPVKQKHLALLKKLADRKTDLKKIEDDLFKKLRSGMVDRKKIDIGHLRQLLAVEGGGARERVDKEYERPEALPVCDWVAGQLESKFGITTPVDAEVSDLEWELRARNVIVSPGMHCLREFALNEERRELGESVSFNISDQFIDKLDRSGFMERMFNRMPTKIAEAVARLGLYEAGQARAETNLPPVAITPAKESPAWERLEIISQIGGDDIARLNGEEHRVTDGGSKLLSALQEKQGEMVLGTTLERVCGERPARIYGALPVQLQAIIDKPGSGKTGYRMRAEPS